MPHIKRLRNRFRLDAFVGEHYSTLWVRNVTLSQSAKSVIQNRVIRARAKASRTLRERRVKREKVARVRAETGLKGTRGTKSDRRVWCALLYWCEGSKIYEKRGGFGFTNSDPRLMTLFMKLLRQGFEVKETKFRVLMQLHSYHNESEEKRFWSKTTNIPITQFLKSHKKKESRVTKRKGYHGCITVKYHDMMLLREMLALTECIFEREGL